MLASYGNTEVHEQKNKRESLTVFESYSSEYFISFHRYGLSFKLSSYITEKQRRVWVIFNHWI